MSRRMSRSFPLSHCLAPGAGQRLTQLAVLGLSALLLALAGGCAGADVETADTSEEPPEIFAALGEGWNTITPGGETTCSDGSEYRFFARKGDPSKLMVYLQGGGGCWNAMTCDREGDPTYTTQAPPSLRSAAGAEPEEGAVHGVLAFGHPENPFADYSVVFVPYCTGDVHIGARTASYTVAAKDDEPEREVTVEHKGFVNGMAALDWTYQAFDAPETIFVTGSSAGAIPSPAYARILKDHYADARIVQLGDGAGGYRSIQDARPHEPWGAMEALAGFPEIAAMRSGEFNFEKLYTVSAAAEPDVMFGRYDTAEDEVQIQFLQVSGQDVTSLQPLLDANEEDIDAAVSNYRSYVAPGVVHTILLRPEFYTYSVGGTRFSRLAGGVRRGRRGERRPLRRVLRAAGPECQSSRAPRAERPESSE